jgi:paraquat-inducible protein B
MAAVRPVAVGAFVLGGLALGVAAILLFGGMRLFTATARIVVVFQGSVAGLNIGSPVTFRGVKVGQVADMKVRVKLPELVPVIPVYLEIEPGKISWTSGSTPPQLADIQDAVNGGLRAQLSSVSVVTGQLSVDLDFHPNTAAALTGADDTVLEVPTIPSDLQHLKDKLLELNLPELSEKARAALASMQHALNEIGGQIEPLADSVKQTAGSAQITLETTTAAVRALQIDAARTLANIDQLAAEGRRQITTNGNQLDHVLTTADRASAQAETLVASLNELTSARSPLRSNLEATLRDLAASASSLRTFTHDLERNPSGTILGKASR